MLPGTGLITFINFSGKRAYEFTEAKRSKYSIAPPVGNIGGGAGGTPN